jgi:hypothetical protein
LTDIFEIMPRDEIESYLADIVTFVNPSMTQDDINNVLATKNYVRFLTGTYNVDVTKMIIPQSNQIIEFEPGVELKAITNALTDYQILKIANTNNLTIKGGLITGDRDTHTGTTGEHGHGVWMENNTNLVIENMKVQKCWGDGFYHLSGETHLINPVSDNNRRNNFTVIGATKLTIDNPVFTNANGTAPQAGIDIEPNSDTDILKKITINNPYFENNVGNDIGIFLYNKQTTEDIINIEINSPSGKCSTLRQAALININYIYPNIKGVININDPFIDNARMLSHSDVSSTVAVNIKNPIMKDWANSNLGAMTLRNSAVLDTNMKLGNIKIDNPTFIINQYSGATVGIEAIDDRNIAVGTDHIYVNNPIVMGAYANNVKVMSPTYGTKFANVFVNGSGQSRMFLDYNYVNQYALNANTQQKLLLPQDILVDSSVGRIEMLVEVVTMNTGGDSGEVALFTWNGTSWSMNEIIPLGKTSSSFPHQLILDTNTFPALKNKNASTNYTFLVRTTISGLYGVAKSFNFYKVNSTLLTKKAQNLASTFAGATSYRPVNPLPNQLYTDTTLGKVIRWDSTAAAWKDMMGTTV